MHAGGSISSDDRTASTTFLDVEVEQPMESKGRASLRDEGTPNKLLIHHVTNAAQGIHLKQRESISQSVQLVPLVGSAKMMGLSQILLIVVTSIVLAYTVV